MRVSLVYNSFIFGGIVLILVLSPILRGAVDVPSICLIAFITMTCLFLFLLRLILEEKLEIRLSGLELPLLLLLVLGTASTFFSIYPEQSKRELGFFFCCLSIYFLSLNFFSNRKRIYFLSLIIVTSGVCLSLLGLFSYAYSMGTSFWKGALSSTYVNHNHFAGYLELCLPLALGLTGYVTEKGKRAILILGIVLMIVSLILTLSRGGWIGAGLSLFFMAYLAKKRGILSKKMWIGAVIWLTLFTAAVFGLNPIMERLSTFDNIFRDPINFDSRIKVWEGTLEVIRDRPLLGTGMGTFAYAFPSHRPAGINCRYLYAHNDFLHFTSEMGIFFLPLFFWTMFSALRMGINTFFKSESRLKRGVSLGCSTGILAIFIHSISDFNLHIPANALLFFVFLGMIGVVRKS
jgi:O-antigen ligase